jgi:Zn-dependent M32 family carboxypeptidase
MNDFSFAIEQNAHFISLSRNVEGLVETAKLMAKLYPEDADAYDPLIDHVQAKSAVDRAKFSGRPDGLLWGARR